MIINFEDYEFPEEDKKRSKPLFEDVLNNGISFKYFITIPYYYKQTNYKKVKEDNKKLRAKIRRFFKEDLRMCFFIERHPDPSSKHHLGFHRHILLEEIPSSKWISPTTSMITFLNKISPDARYEVASQSGISDLNKTALLKRVCRLCKSVPNGLIGLDIRPIYDIHRLLGYCTKQSGTLMPHDAVIDRDNSDIGNAWLNQIEDQISISSLLPLFA